MGRPLAQLTAVNWGLLHLPSPPPPALLGFRALNFLDIDSSEIEMVEIVCVSVGSFPVSTGGQTVFLERLVPFIVFKLP